MYDAKYGYSYNYEDGDFKSTWFKNEKERQEAYDKAEKLLKDAGCDDEGLLYFLGSRNVKDEDKRDVDDEGVWTIVRHPEYVKLFDLSTVYGKCYLSSMIY